MLLTISAHKTQTMTFIRTPRKRSKIVIGLQEVQQVNNFDYLECSVSYLKKIPLQK